MESPDRDSSDSSANGVQATLESRNGQPIRGGLVAPRRLDASAATRPPRSSGSGDTENLDPTVLLHSLRRRWPLALLLGLLLGPPLAAAAWFLMVPKHSAIAYLRIDSQNSMLMFQTADQLAGGRNSFDLYKNTQAELLRTPFVLNKALADEDVRALKLIQAQPNAFQWLSEELKVGFPNKGEVMQIELETPDAEASVKIVQAIVDAFMNESVLEERNERLQRLDTLERARAETEGTVRARRADIRKLADALGTSDSESLSVAQQMSVERYGQVQSELGKVNFELLRAEGELNAFRQIAAKLNSEVTALSQSNSDTSGESRADGETADDDGDAAIDSVALTDLEIERVMLGDRRYQQMVSEKRAVEDRVAIYRTQFGEGMFKTDLAKLERLDLEMERRKDQMVAMALEEKRLKVDNGGLNVSAIDPTLSPQQQEAELRRRELIEEAKTRADEISAREIRVGILQQQKAQIEQDLARLEAEFKKLGRSSVDIEMMRAEIVSLDETLSRLAGEIERTKIELKAGSRIEVISEATRMASSDAKKRYAATGGLGLFGFLLPFVAFIGLDVRKKLINDAETVSKDTGLTVLGSVPRERNLSQQLASDSLVDGSFGNSVSSIVAMLVNQSRFEQFQTLMVTSAVAGEGKSTLSQSLWRGLADANYRTLLLDFDLRRPSVHHNLGRKDMPAGLGEIIRGEVAWETTVHEHGPQRSVIFAGQAKQLNLAAAAHGVLPNLFHELQDQYDFVIVDTAPILPVVDTRILGEHVDAAVLSIMKDRSRMPQIIAATETLRAHHTPLLGAVVNACSPKTKDYGYHYGYYSG